MSIWHRITTDKAHGKLFGVCSGLAKAFGYSRLGVRCVAVLGLLFMPVVTFTIYATAAVLLPTRQQA
ncbi:PspC domain-containing protein [Psychrobium sp. 1_MG-2023]|uniref:PspC domain-containing protein n=1 Tax=Psychrobium sp. 1_MG-2023 TaxID=3062624 RepID=UPI000C3214C8|nr:PspC domain-containing protein [Psychrobium sp. 1_MG-2023]MDP2559692.1 PspC domain-containing protein [Psychrobium sp. 1_MG-2023]PKF59523.1 hypothetical protein CW748_01755 [Alteromonadales bacterium alter-6D02]